MKKVFLLIALVATVFASNACGKKDDFKPQEQPKDSLEQKLIGKWKITDIGLDADGKEIQRYFFSCQYTEFFTNKKGENITYDHPDCDRTPDETRKVVQSFTWSIENNNLIMMVNEDNKSIFRNINISNDTMKTEVQTLSKEDKTVFDDDTNVVKHYYYYERIK